MNGIMIKNIADNSLNFELRDLVPLIEGENFHWRLLDFYAFGSSDPDFNVPEFEKKAISSENGLPITWQEIRRVGLTVRQTIDCLLIGDRNEDNLKVYRTDEERNAACEIVLELIDGGQWEIHAKDPEIIDRVVKHFKGNASFKITEIR